MASKDARVSVRTVRSTLIFLIRNDKRLRVKRTAISVNSRRETEAITRRLYDWADQLSKRVAPRRVSSGAWPKTAAW
jgi:hypothetical protein